MAPITVNAPPHNKAIQVITRRSVLIAIGVVVGLLIIVDIFLATDVVAGNTWSELLREAAEHTPVVSWLWGLIMGHWFHPNDDQTPVIAPPLNALVLLTLSLFVLVIGYGVTVSPWVPLVIAVPIGALLWPMSASRALVPELGNE